MEEARNQRIGLSVLLIGVCRYKAFCQNSITLKSNTSKSCVYVVCWISLAAIFVKTSCHPSVLWSWRYHTQFPKCSKKPRKYFNPEHSSISTVGVYLQYFTVPSIPSFGAPRAWWMSRNSISMWKGLCENRFLSTSLALGFLLYHKIITIRIKDEIRCCCLRRPYRFGFCLCPCRLQWGMFVE